MTLNQFRSIDLTWDRANGRIYEAIRVASSDENGRKLTVRVSNGSLVEDLSSATLNLYWETTNAKNKGLDAFEVVDASRGIFEIYFTTGMLSNVGKLYAWLQLVDTAGTVTSERFDITVFRGIDNDAAESENSFTSLTTALVRVNNIDADINDLDVKKADKAALATTNMALATTNTEVARKADKIYVDNRIDNVTQGGPADTFANLSALQSAYPNGANKPMLVLEGDGVTAYVYTWTGNTWKKGVLYQSQGIDDKSIDTDKLKFDAVTPMETTFAKMGKNKHNGTYFPFALVGGWGALGVTLNKRQNAISAIVEVEPDKTYIVYTENTTDRLRVAGFDDIPSDLSQGTLLTGNDGGTSAIFTTSSQTRYAVIYLKSEAGTVYPQNLMVERGTQKTGFKKPKTVIEIEDKSIQSNQIQNHIPTAVSVGLPNTLKIFLKDEYIDTADTLVMVGETRIVLEAARYDFSDFSAQTVVVLVNLSTKEIEFYVSSQLPTSSNYAYLGYIRRGLTCGVNGAYRLEDSDVVPYTATEKNLLQSLSSSGNERDFFIPNVQKTYETDAEYHLPVGNLANLYGRYDQLVTDYPSYVSRTKLADDEENNPIYRYDFKRPGIWLDGVQTELPKIVLTGVHAHEHQSQMALIGLMEEICAKRLTDDFCHKIYNNVHLVVIPTLNPYGINKGSRVTANGVDLNRNFPDGWTVQGEDTFYYSGTEPLSEVGSQTLYSVMQNEKNVLGAIDIHNSETDFANNLEPTWIGAVGSTNKKIALGTITRAREIVDKYNIANRDLNYRVRSPVKASVTNQWAVEGVRAFILEMTWRAEGSLEDGQKMNIEFITNIIECLMAQAG
ncbi:MAG: DUF2817 domain-containing protein [Enterococcus lemanii]|jgi:hypothetical protein